MTTFQTILCLVILAVLVGAYMFYQAYKGKKTKIEFTPDNVKTTLTELGALDIYEPSGGGFMFHTSGGRVFMLDTATLPIVQLITS